MPSASPALRRRQQEQRNHQDQQHERLRPPAALDLPRTAFAYTRCYCEENVYLLLAQLQALLPPPASSSASSCRLLALFISNKIRACPVWGQRAGAEAGEREEEEGGMERDEDGEEDEEEEEEAASPVLWDYHVVALLETADGGATYIYDLDTRLEPFPCLASEYVRQAFRPDIAMTEEYRQRFRLVPFLPSFRDGFASDRSHMRRTDGSWNAPPPAYPPIRGATAASAMTLPTYWAIDEEGEGGREEAKEGGLGRVLSLGELQARVGAGVGGGGGGRPPSAAVERER